MIERVIKFSTLPGDSICDAFSGTGTVLRAVKNLSTSPPQCSIGILGQGFPSRNPVTSIEISPSYCSRIAYEHDLAIEFPGAQKTA